MAKKEDIYRYIRIGGLASLIPLVLLTGPVIGYAAGNYLKEKFGFGNAVVVAMTSIGLVFGISETIKIIKKVIHFGTAG